MSDSYVSGDDDASSMISDAPLRASMTAWQGWSEVIGVILVTAGAVIGAKALVNYGHPWWATAVVAAYVLMLYFAAPVYDYLWVELDGDTLRGKHLYLRHITERPVADIDHIEFLNVTMPESKTFVQVHAMRIRFRGRWSAINISQFKPKMRRGKELLEAVIACMSTIGEVGFEREDRNGKSLIRRVYWATPPERPSRDW